MAGPRRTTHPSHLKKPSLRHLEFPVFIAKGPSSPNNCTMNVRQHAIRLFPSINDHLDHFIGWLITYKMAAQFPGYKPDAAFVGAKEVHEIAQLLFTFRLGIKSCRFELLVQHGVCAWLMNIRNIAHIWVFNMYAFLTLSDKSSPGHNIRSVDHIFLRISTLG